jgi:gliding motility-associated transport system permease protein/gliding motility-associatede transport system auxiliary component
VTTLETKPTSEGRAATRPTARRTRPGHPHVIWAVFKRNFMSYFSNPLGYLFITLFVLVSSFMAFWQPLFFTNNQANLDELNKYMQYLLLLFIPAITMTTWADERKQGTDELLLTLPAHDLDVVLGKYLAALGIFTVALAFSLPQVFVLEWLGSPDLGVLFATYLGYWLMGVLLIALAMVASMLSSNVTVAFILGALFCAVPIFLGMIGSFSGDWSRRVFERWSMASQFQDFGSGVVTLEGLFYFVGLAAAMLYLNMVLLGRRHWAGGEASSNHWLHSMVRILAVIVAVSSITVIVNRLGKRQDVSWEQLHALSTESLELAKNISADRPVLVQAFISPDVPKEYVEVRSDLLGKLKEYEAKSGGKIRLNLVPTEVFSEEARQAEKRFGIEPHRVFSNDQGKQMSDEVFLGVAFTSGTEEVVIPFFDRGLPVEYELTRSIRVVSRAGRKKLGILTTDAKLMGGLDMRTFNQTPEWSIVTELKKQYDVSSVSADTPIAADLDVLLVAQPSSLSQKQIDGVTDYVRKGGATLLFLDPFPFDNPSLSPELPKQPPGGPFGGGQPPEPKGNLRELLDLCGIDWPTTEIVWNAYNPHPKLADLQATPEIVFIGKGSGAPEAFNEEQNASAGLQEIVALFAGMFRSKSVGSGLEFTPLLQTGPTGGTLMWSDVVQQGFMGISGINPRRRHIPTGRNYTLAARITGQLPADASKDATKDAEKKDAEKKKDAKPAGAKINVIAIADLDFIGEQFFELRRRKIEDLEFDNVPFVLNCVDVLAGDESFVKLRRKRPVHRRLDALEARAKDFDKVLAEKTKQAEDLASEELEAAQKDFQKQVDAVQSHAEWDDRTKEIQLANIQRIAQRRLDVAKTTVEDKKLAEIREAKAESEVQIRGIRNVVRFAAMSIPPLPPLILGLIVWIRRRTLENVGANPKRLVYDTRPASGSPPKS